MVIRKNSYAQQLAWSAFGLFAILTILVKANFAFIQDIDNVMTDVIARLDSPAHTTFFKFIGTLGSPIVTLSVALVFSGILYLHHQRRLGLLVSVTMVSGDALALLIKQLVQRARPSNQLISDTGYSFPSGHVFGTTLLVILLITIGVSQLQNPRLQVLLTLLGVAWILLVIVARLYARAHYASDTLGSVLLASGCWQQAKVGVWHWRTQLLTKSNRN